MIECEFPPLVELNKLGDVSLRSANQVDDANLAFVNKLIRGISIPFLGPRVYLIMSSAASSNLLSKANKVCRGSGATYIGSLRDGIPDAAKKGDVVLFASPPSSQDYAAASRIAADGLTAVLVNGVAKVLVIGSRVRGYMY